jgi:DNA-binding MarR family transcriptional regulator
MGDDDLDRTGSIREQLRNHQLPKEWVKELGCVDADTTLLMMWLDILSRRVHSAHLQEVRREGLAYSEAKLMYYLLLEGPPYHQSPTRLNANLELTSGGITKTVDRLEVRGLVTRRPDADDGRSIKVGLTDQGVEAARRVAHAFAERYRELTGSLGVDQRRRTVQMLRTLLDALDGPL